MIPSNKNTLTKFNITCIILFIIITIVFTVGYASQPLITASQTITIPPSDGVITTMSATEILNFNSLLISSNNNSSLDYSNSSSSIKLMFTSLYSLCISSTVLLSLGIILALFKKIFISKIVLLIALIIMLIMFILLTIIYLTISIASIGTNYFTSFITNYIVSYIKDKVKDLPESIQPSIIEPSIKNIINYNSGYILISIATLLLFITHMIYMYFG